MVYEPSVFEPLKFYCTFLDIRGYVEISVFEISRADSKRFCSITMVTVTVYENPVGYICIRKRQVHLFMSTCVIILRQNDRYLSY